MKKIRWTNGTMKPLPKGVVILTNLALMPKTPKVPKVTRSQINKPKK